MRKKKKGSIEKQTTSNSQFITVFALPELFFHEKKKVKKKLYKIGFEAIIQ
jgi:hypothetical protein